MSQREDYEAVQTPKIRGSHLTRISEDVMKRPEYKSHPKYMKKYFVFC